MTFHRSLPPSRRRRCKENKVGGMEYNGNKVEELCFFKKLKLKDIKNISQGKEVEILIKNIATMTNEKVEKIEELDTNDFDYTSSIYAFLQKK